MHSEKARSAGKMRGFIKETTAIREVAQIECRLDSVSKLKRNMVRYSLTTRQYELLPDCDLFEELLTLPPTTILKEDVRMREERKMLQEAIKMKDWEASYHASEEGMDEISKEELRKLDSQPNPFNFCERGGQTNAVIWKDKTVATEPPPSTSFSANVGLGDIYDAYKKDFEKRELALAKNIQEDPKWSGELDWDSETLFGEPFRNIQNMVFAARTLERMVSQNIYDEISQDFKYWEDGSDDFKPMEGSLLPLWRFTHESLKNLTISSVCWSPTYSDLFSVAYRSCDIGSEEGDGAVCLFSLKNPAAPERIIVSEAGIVSVDFHPRLASVLCVGRTDGCVMVLDMKSLKNPIELKSKATTGKHYLPVCQVHWINTDPGEDISFFSVSLDGRITQWTVHGATLICNDLLDFSQQAQLVVPNGHNPSSSVQDKASLEGRGICLAFKPKDEGVLLVGCDTGVIFQLTTTGSTPDMIRYEAHSAAVRELRWNYFNSCPLIVLDIGSPCVGVEWSPTVSTVLVAANDVGRINVFDLNLRQGHPLCVQNLSQKRSLSLTTLGFSPFYPVILVGGREGYLVSFKLSPNLRRCRRYAKGIDEQRYFELEMEKIQRIIDSTKARF